MSKIITRPTDFWVPSLSAKQMVAFNDFHRFLLLSGPRKSSKSWASCHKIVRHCFDVNDALVLMVSRNIKTAKEGGIWTYLVEKVLPEWIEAGITSYIRPPCQDNQTRTLYLTIRNRWGGTSKVMLNSLDFDDNAEALFKERAFSMVYFSELSKWMKRKVLDVSALCLRRPGIPYGQHQWLADTNPADDGERSWIYQYFWNERLMEDVPDYIKGDEATARFRKRQGETNVLEIFLQDNPFISQDEIDDVISTHAYDPDLYARYVEGRWIAGSEDGFFSSTFKHAIHILGSVHHPSRSQWEVVMVPENTTEMQVGTDLGDKSSAVTFAYKVLDEKARNEYYIVDEIIVDNDSVSLDSLTEAILKVMDKWEAYVGHAIMWRFGSDTSSFNKKLSARDTEAMLLFQISKGRIRLEPVDKYKGSVNDGIAMIRRMFFENRLFISANCLHTIAMVKSFKPERARGTGVQKVPDNMHTHPFDALRYILLSNEPRDIARRRPQVARAPARIVSM